MIFPIFLLPDEYLIRTGRWHNMLHLNCLNLSMRLDIRQLYIKYLIQIQISKHWLLIECDEVFSNLKHLSVFWIHDEADLKFGGKSMTDFVLLIFILIDHLILLAYLVL